MPLLRFFTPLNSAVLILIGSLFAITGAWYIELVLDIKPCHLCLIGRIPHYVGIPVALAAILANRRSAPPLLGRVLLGALTLIFIVGTGIAAYHSGVEFGIFQGPTDCTGAIEKPVAIQDFLKQLQTVKLVRCDEVVMRIFGLSLASWNALISASLSALAALGIAAKRA